MQKTGSVISDSSQNKLLSKSTGEFLFSQVSALSCMKPMGSFSWAAVGGGLQVPS